MINFNHTNHTRFLRETSLSRKKARHTANQIAQHQSTTEFTVSYLLLSTVIVYNEEKKTIERKRLRLRRYTNQLARKK